jgi:hypothetical protein
VIDEPSRLSQWFNPMPAIRADEHVVCVDRTYRIVVPGDGGHFGTFVVTTRRLIFQPNRLDQLVRMKTSEWQRSDYVGAELPAERHSNPVRKWIANAGSTSDIAHLYFGTDMVRVALQGSKKLLRALETDCP